MSNIRDSIGEIAGEFGLTPQEWSTDLAQYVGAIVLVDDTLEDMRRPLGKQEIADLLGYPRTTVYTWCNRGLLPEPAGSLSSVPYWWDKDILEWAEATGRAGRRPTDATPAG